MLKLEDFKKSVMFRSIFEAAPDYIYLTDIEGHILDANPALLTRIGKSLDEVLQMHPLGFFAGENLAEVLNAVETLRNGGTVKGLEVKAQSASGETFEYEVNAIPIFDQGKVVGVLNLARDITERKEKERLIKESEEKYRTLILSVKDIIVEITSDGTVLYISPQVLEILGYEPAELIGKSALDSIHPDDLMRVAEKLKEGLSTLEQTVLIDYRVRHKDGRYIIMSARGSFDTERNRFTSTLRDITSQKQAEEQLKESETKYRTFVENFHGIVFKGNLDFTPLFFHGRVEGMTGYTEADFCAGKPRWDEVIHPQDRKRITNPKLVESMKRTPNITREFEYRIVTRENTIRWVHEFVQSVADVSGRVTCVQGVIHDITERKLLEMAGEKHTAIMKSLILELDNTTFEEQRIGAKIAHEINNPLMGIINYAQLLKDGGDDVPPTFIDGILREAHRIEKIVSQMISKKSKEGV